MKLVLHIKLVSTPEQHCALLETLERFNDACNTIAAVAFKHHTANKIRIQQLIYHQIRRQYGLSAQMTIRAISKVAEAFKRDKTAQPTFNPHGAIIYDQRILSWKGLDCVSILTLQGRQLIPIRFGAYQHARMHRIKGQADLVLRDDIFYLIATIDVPEAESYTANNWLGVDLGIRNIAVDSDGEKHSGSHLNNLRWRHAKLRAKLQRKRTKSARHLLKKRSKKEKRFATDMNHCISKRLVAKAKDTHRGLVLEDLTGIRARVTVRRHQRRTLHSWAFHQLRQFISYKAKLSGVPIQFINPAYTSRTCPYCGYVDMGNRNGGNFKCLCCGFAGAADHIAAVNIHGRVAVNQPDISEREHLSCSPSGQATDFSRE